MPSLGGARNSGGTYIAGTPSSTGFVNAAQPETAASSRLAAAQVIPLGLRAPTLLNPLARRGVLPMLPDTTKALSWPLFY